MVDVGADLWPMMLYSLRYIMGSSSYAVGSWAEWIDRYGNHLADHQLAQLEREIREAIRFAEFSGGKLGDACDHRTWQRTATSIALMRNARGRKGGIVTLPRARAHGYEAELADAVVAEVEALQERVNDHREEADVMYDRYKRVVVERDAAQKERDRFRSALVAYAHHGHWDNDDDDAPYRRCFVWLCHEDGADEPLEYGGTLAAKTLAGEPTGGEENGTTGIATRRGNRMRG